LAKRDKKSGILRLESADSRHAAEHPSALPQPAKSPATLGADLKAARTEKNITLKQVSEDTRISLRHFQSLEDGRYSDLPGGMYNRAFLRSYCVYLGLEPADFLVRYEAESAPHSEKAVKSKPRSQPIVAQPRKVPQLLIWSLMLLASIAGLYFSRGWIAQVFSPYFSHRPTSHIPISAPTPAPAPSQAKVAQTTPPTTPAANPVDQPPVTAATSGTTTQVHAEPPPGTIRLSFEVVDPCWMSLTSDGTRVYSDTLHRGNTPFFDAKEQFEMVLGNAGGIKLKINGKAAKPLGVPGAVIKLLINAANIPELLEKMIK
jgi:cytoskeleton protein RodZ